MRSAKETTPELFLPPRHEGEARPTAEEMGALPARPAPPAAPEQPPTPAVSGLPPAPAKTPNVRKCKHCGKEFTAVHYSNTFCSQECGKAAHKIARLGKEKPVTFARVSSHSDMPHQIIQEGDVW